MHKSWIGPLYTLIHVFDALAHTQSHPFAQFVFGLLFRWGLNASPSLLFSVPSFMNAERDCRMDLWGEYTVCALCQPNDSRIVFHLRRVGRGLFAQYFISSIAHTTHFVCVCSCTTSSFHLIFSFFQFLVANECVTNKTWCERVTATPSAPWIDRNSHTQFASFHFASPQSSGDHTCVFVVPKKKSYKKMKQNYATKINRHTVSHTHIHSRSLHHLRCCWTTCALTRIRIHMRRHTQRIDAASPKYQNQRCCCYINAATIFHSISFKHTTHHSPSLSLSLADSHT